MSDEIFDPNQREELTQLSENKFSLKDFIRNNKIPIITAGAVVVTLGIVAAILFWPKPQKVQESNNVVLTIKGPAQISSGDEAEYRVIYRNGENSDLVSLTLELFYPAGFKYKSAQPAAVSSTGTRFNLPLLKSGQDGEVKIRGKLSGATSEDKLIAAKLVYKLADFNSEFEVKTDFHTLILAPSITLDITGPIEAINGQETTYSIVYSNVSGQTFDNLVLQMQYPDGFDFVSSNPKTSRDNNYWIIPRLSAGSRGQIDIAGSFSGEPNSEMLVIAEMGQLLNGNLAPLLTTSASFRIVPASLSLTVSSEPSDVVELGQSLEFNLQYGNQGNIGATNVVITLTLESTVLDLNRIGVYNAVVTGNTITWRSATLSNLGTLSPNQKGEITFTVPVKTNLPSNLKNQMVKTVAYIKSDQMPKAVRANDLELKLVSQLGLLVSGEYVSGALPMKVGQSTTFAVTFLATNLSNDLTDAEVIASMLLPPSSWNDVIIPQSEKINLSYDSNAGKIRWKIGILPAFTGKYTPAKSVTFQLVVTPTEADRGKVSDLLADISAEALDTFVNRPVKSVTVDQLNVSDLDDDQINQVGSSVQ